MLYLIQTKEPVPMKERGIPSVTPSGALVFHNDKQEVIRIVASGLWLEVVKAPE